MRALLLFVGVFVLGPLTGCSGRQYLFVTLDSAAPITFAALDVTVDNAGKTGTARYDRGASIPPAATAVLHFDDDRSGEARVTFIARDATGNELARGSSTVTLVPHERTDVFITLGKQSEVVDGGAGDGGDGGGGDMAVADMAVGDMAMPDLPPAPDMTPVLGFAPVATVPVGPGQAFYLWFEDADKDGLTDIHTTVYLNQVTQLATLRGQKGGGYRLPLYESTGFSSIVAMVDLNGDRVLDLVSGSANSLDGAAKLAKGDGTFRLGSFLQVKDKTYEVLAADYDRDGKADVALSSPGNVRFLGGRGDGSFRAPLDSAVMYVPMAPLAGGDINEDGVTDFMFLRDGGGQILSVLSAVNGTFRAGMSVNIPSIGFPTLGDFNVDGHLDLLLSPYGMDTFGVLPGVGNGTFKAPITSKGTLASGLVPADLDADGLLDLVGVSSKLQNIVISRGKGDGTFANPMVLTGLPSMHDDTAVYDVDADGDLDIAVTLTVNGQGAVAIFQNTLR